MSRALSVTALAAIFAQETGEAPLFLVELDHTDWANPVRIVDNNVAIVSSGDTFSPFSMSLMIPLEDMAKVAQSKLEVCNVDRQMIALLRPVASRVSVEVSLILGSEPDTIIGGPWAFKLTDVTYDVFTIKGDLTFGANRSEPFPAGIYNPADFPGLFA
ncbi:MAG: DUF1833 family protein [Candidatus Eisenbacteria sp.]|nr:DUF1833 family protein [Candidatus Eisenbacteria bacterium]